VVADHLVGIAYYHTPIPNISKRETMNTRDEKRVCMKVLKGEDISEEEKEFAASAIKKGYIKNNEGKLELAIPAVSVEQGKEFRKIIWDDYDDIMPEYKKHVKKYADGYKKLFPERFREYAPCYFIFGNLYGKTLAYWAESGTIKFPEDRPMHMEALLEIGNAGVFL
jgi:hypothetical protein